MLDGLRVLDLATLAAAPLVATYLGEFGAEVIKVEQPVHGDPIRSWGNQRDGVGLMWKSVSRNKRSITLELRCAEGQDLVRRLVQRADVIIVNTRPQTLRKWGLDYESLRGVNDRIVMLHITGYGLTGPKSERPGFGTLGEAMSGFAHITGQAGGPPTLPPFMLADGVASLNAAYAVMMALYHRDVHGGPGQLIDVNLIDPLARLLEQTLLGYDQLGLVPERSGNRWDISAPRNTYQTSDGRWLAMSGSSPALALRVFQAIGRDDLVRDADFSDPQRRLARAREVDDVVADWVAARTLCEAMSILEAHDVAAAPVYDITDLVDDEQLTHRGVFVSVPDAELGPMTVQAPVPRFSQASGAVGHLGPRLGEHNEQVLKELLGLSDNDIDELRQRGVI
ncbi:CaiB/BaiF CoA transferase family protein [Mycobacterium paragordonae]|uniref:CoA transferase n=1 Tax=Mycobacterium paragordonae TaxID=1389713 RepID=A0A4R5WM07_9MYCO|nr:CoA transferase [Mycobacterium paragordonae]MDP7738171.1 CoA transferase [Mycobacterium paragordonae]TDK92217.1 CoA transferase [Mycobacterium paragordonae]TDL04368.1 CoA transferase [Mycobacterium paragordonae]